MLHSLSDGFSTVTPDGQTIFEIVSAAGADMTDAPMSWLGLTPMAMYAASTPPATVAKPPVMMQCISDGVALGRMFLTSKGASVCPRKILPAAFTDSTVLLPSANLRTAATTRTVACRTPK
eukprot:5369395-Pyramimonas_sp.AAC.1